MVGVFALTISYLVQCSHRVYNQVSNANLFAFELTHVIFLSSLGTIAFCMFGLTAIRQLWATASKRASYDPLTNVGGGSGNASEVPPEI